MSPGACASPTELSVYTHPFEGPVDVDSIARPRMWLIQTVDSTVKQHPLGVAWFLSLFIRTLSLTVKLNLWLETPFLQNSL